MKILYLSSCLSRGAGGIFEIERSLAQNLQQSFDVDIDVMGVVDPLWESDREKWGSVPVRAFPVVGPSRFGYSPKLRKAVLAESGHELAHLHDLWQYPAMLIQSWAKQKCRPYVLTPNGMLEPWALENSKWKKRIASLLFQRSGLVRAGCLQANTVKEMNDFRGYGLRNPVAIIPNGVLLPDASFDVADHQQRDKSFRTLLFLGRVHPKKGLPDLLRAWDDAKDCRRRGSWRIVIAGWNQNSHLEELLAQCQAMGLAGAQMSIAEFFSRFDRHSVDQNRAPNDSPHSCLPPEIIFVGPAFGDDKTRLMQMADAFVLPSHSEGFPMAVLEAWAHRLPVLMTPECNIPEGFSADAALKITHGSTAAGTEADPSFATGLRRLFEMDDSDRAQMGQRGFDLVKRRFTWPQVAAQMKDVYHWLLSGGAPPETVHLN